MVAELKEERKKLEAMVARLNESTTDMLLATAEEVGGAKLVVHHAREGEDAMSLAITLMSRPGVIAVVASSVPGVKLIVGRSQDVDMDARPVLKEIMKLIGGGGAGNRTSPKAAGETRPRCPRRSPRRPGSCAPRWPHDDLPSISGHSSSGKQTVK